MNILKSLCIAVMVATPLLGMAMPTFAHENPTADPFEVSKENCMFLGWVDECATTNEKVGVISMQEVAKRLNTTVERLKRINRWGDEVTPDTLVPIGSTFAFP